MSQPSSSDENEKIRVSKLLADQGLCSRREADQYIERGWVRVDGQVVSELGTRAYRHQTVSLDPKATRQQEARITIILNKPIGYVSHDDDDGRYPAAAQLITPENQWQDDRQRAHGQRLPKVIRGLAPAGRLDIDSTGLLVLTQDGRIARHLIGEDATIEKEYLVRVEGSLPPDGLKRLQHGLSLDSVPLKPAKVSWQNEHQLRFVLREGKKRQIRRMCELVGLKVTGLKRIRIGRMPLGSLPLGQWRALEPSEKF